MNRFAGAATMLKMIPGLTFGPISPRSYVAKGMANRKMLAAPYSFMKLLLPRSTLARVIYLLCCAILPLAAVPASPYSHATDPGKSPGPVSPDVVPSVLIDARRINIADSRNIRILTQSPVRRLMITLFSDGTTISPPTSSPFQQIARYRSKSNDPIISILEDCHTKNILVYGVVDCLRWVAPYAGKSADVLKGQPELAELVAGGSVGPAERGKYASPFHPNVQRILIDLVEQIVKRYPALDGIVLRYQLPTEDLYGFNKVGRAAYIRARGIDPLDINLSSMKDRQQLFPEWSDWRLTEATARMAELCTAARRINPALRIAVIGNPREYDLTLRHRARSLNDWLSWLKLDGVDELILEGDWIAPEMRDAFTRAEQLARQSGKQQRISTLNALRVSGQKYDPMPGLTITTAQGGVAPIVAVSDPADLPRLTGIWTQWLRLLRGPQRTDSSSLHKSG